MLALVQFRSVGGHPALTATGNALRLLQMPSALCEGVAARGRANTDAAEREREELAALRRQWADQLPRIRRTIRASTR